MSMAVAARTDKEDFKDRIAARVRAARKNKALLLLSVQKVYEGRLQGDRLAGDLRSNDLETLMAVEAIVSFFSQMVNEVIEINRFTIQHFEWCERSEVTARQGVMLLVQRSVIDKDMSDTFCRLMRIRHGLEHHRDYLTLREAESITWAIACGHLVIEQYLEAYEQRIEALISRPRLEVVDAPPVIAPDPPKALSPLERRAPHHRRRGPQPDFSGPQPGQAGRVRRPAPASDLGV